MDSRQWTRDGFRSQRHLARVQELLRQQPVVGVLGARQVGKTTLARQLAGTWDEAMIHFDLEDPEVLARLADPKLALAELPSSVCSSTAPTLASGS